MSDKINRLIQQANIDKERAERLLEEIQVMDKQIADLTAALAEAREALEDDYVLKSVAWDGCQKSIQRARDKALEEAAFVLECKAAYFSALPWQSGRHKEVQQRYRDDAAAIRALKEKP